MDKVLAYIKNHNKGNIEKIKRVELICCLRKLKERKGLDG